jgi:hypothetical protein
MLARQVLNHWSHSASSFYIVYFWERRPLHAQAGLDCNPPICASLGSWDDRCKTLCSAIDWDGVLWIFCPFWPWTMILLISTSYIARITGLSHQDQLDLPFLQEGARKEIVFSAYKLFHISVTLPRKTKERELLVTQWEGPSRPFHHVFWLQWCTLVIPLTWEAEARGL